MRLPSVWSSLWTPFECENQDHQAPSLIQSSVADKSRGVLALKKIASLAHDETGETVGEGVAPDEPPCKEIGKRGREMEAGREAEQESRNKEGMWRHIKENDTVSLSRMHTSTLTQAHKHTCVDAVKMKEERDYLIKVNVKARTEKTGWIQRNTLNARSQWCIPHSPTLDSRLAENITLWCIHPNIDSWLGENFSRQTLPVKSSSWVARRGARDATEKNYRKCKWLTSGWCKLTKKDRKLG